MRTIARFATVVCLMLVLPGCRSHPDERNPRPRFRADLITLEEINSREWTDAYQMISALRSNWLNDRGPDSFFLTSDVQVLVDGVHLGGLSNLKGQPVGGLVRAQFYDPITAAAKWGLKFNKGAIDLTTTASANGTKP